MTRARNVPMLREVYEDDIDVFFEHQRDPVGGHMVAFTSKDPNDRDAYVARWRTILADDSIVKRTILWNDEVAGNVVSFVRGGRREVGYWLGAAFWGKGIATRALAEFLTIVDARPLYGVAAADNAGSIRVLEKCGFKIVWRTREFANARGEEIEAVELILE